jgi:hypothetical protein
MMASLFVKSKEILFVTCIFIIIFLIILMGNHEDLMYVY